ncbi:MAG TPA: sulfurtransferase [Gammaproteobacteria bacterium]|nr:sulfurtransferase [Gammaproteobacteria bacterium]
MQNISPTELKQWLRQTNPPQLVDFRQRWEYELCHIPESILISLEELEQIDQFLATDRAIVTICHYGHRSRQAAKYLETFLGIRDIHNLEGGIDAWAKEVDSEMEIY